jgi:hypothetical protein
MVLGFVASLFLLLSCVDESSRKGKPLINRIGGTAEEVQFCALTYNIVEESCINSCPIGTRVASVQEIADAKTELNSLNLEEARLTQIFGDIDAANEVCINGSGVLRPDNEVFIDGGFCACKNGQAYSVNNCEATCAARSNDTNLTLVGRVTVGPQISLNSVFADNSDTGNLSGWCTNEIPGSDFTGPACQLEATGGGTTRYLDLIVPTDSNTFTVNIENLPKEVTNVLRIRETGSRSNVQSNAFQIYLKEPEADTSNPVGPLKIMPTSKYTCIFRSRTTLADGSQSFQQHARQHFYFAATVTPPALPAGDPLIICHDVQVYGEDDSSEFPRLEIIPQYFAVWDQSDPRFNDGDIDGIIDINEEITEEFKVKTNQQSNSSVSLKLFSIFPWQNLPAANGFKDITSANLGLIMIPFVDNFNRGKCPTQEDYLGDNALFQIIGDKVGVDTEGIYMAESEALQDGQGGNIQDIIMVREKDLKAVSFFLQGTTKFKADESSMGSQTIKFYFPFDPVNPLVKKTTQQLYTVRFPDQIGKNGVQTGVVQGTRPPDKRFGCIPAIN